MMKRLDLISTARCCRLVVTLLALMTMLNVGEANAARHQTKRNEMKRKSSLVSQVATAQNQFGLELFAKAAINVTHQNVAVSPPSVATVLALLSAGAGGRTRQQIRHALHWLGRRHGYSRAHHQLISDLTSHDINLNTLSRVYINSKQRANDVFRRRLSHWFHMQPSMLDFASSKEATAVINRDISRATNGTITHLADSMELDHNTLMVLLSAVFFRANWLHPFDVALTHKHRFLAADGGVVNVDTMKMNGHFQFGHVEQLQSYVLQLPYKNNATSMLLILPDHEQAMDSVIANLSSVDISKITASLYRAYYMDVAIPKFRLQHQSDLTQLLPKLGVSDIFRPGVAQLSGCVSAGNVFVSDALHKCVINVDERGTEASAATVMGLRPRMLGQSFFVDRPFLALIVDSTHNTVLFAARVNNPAM